MDQKHLIHHLLESCWKKLADFYLRPEVVDRYDYPHFERHDDWKVNDVFLMFLVEGEETKVPAYEMVKEILSMMSPETLAQLQTWICVWRPIDLTGDNTRREILSRVFAYAIYCGLDAKTFSLYVTLRGPGGTTKETMDEEGMEH